MFPMLAGIVLLATAVAGAQENDSRPPRGGPAAGASARRPPEPCGSGDACREAFGAKQRGIRSLAAGFRQTRVEPGKAPVVGSGRMSYTAPSTVRWELLEPSPFVVETKGASLSAGAPGSVKAIAPGAATPTEALFGELGVLFTATDRYAQGRFDASEGDGGPQTLRLTPRSATPDGIASIEVELDPTTGILRRALIREKGGAYTEVALVEALRDASPGQSDR